MMNISDVYIELEKFYEIRGDSYAKKYVMDFIKKAGGENIKPEQYGWWFHNHKDEIGESYKKDTKVNYQRILTQFIRYLDLIVMKKQMGSKKNTHKRKPTKIYDTYYKFQQHSLGK